MDVLDSLGVNQTIVLQFGVFLVCYLIISNLLFKPYFAAFSKRDELTVGQSAEASQIWKQVELLQQQFESEAKDLNMKVKEIYDAHKIESSKLYNEALIVARQEAKELLENSRKTLKLEIQSLEKPLANEIAEMSHLIQKQVIQHSTEAS